MPYLLSAKQKLDAEIEMVKNDIKMLEGADGDNLGSNSGNGDDVDMHDESEQEENDALVREITVMFKNVKPEVIDFAASIVKSTVDDLKAGNQRAEE